MSHDETLAEPDNPKVLMIVAATAATIALVIGIVIGVNAFWEQTVAEQVGHMVGSQDPRFKALKNEEKQKLGNYAWVDKKAGVARLPLDRAVDLTLRDWKSRPEGTAGTAAPAGTAPLAPGATPPTGVAPGAPGTVPPAAPAPKPAPAPGPKHK